MDFEKSNMEVKAKIRIGNTALGYKMPCFIIAEAGVNHNGKFKLAKRLIDAAVDAGADAVKFQTFKTEGVVTKDAGTAGCAGKNIEKKLRQMQMMKKLELPYKDFKKLKKYCDGKKIIFLSTPHSEDAVDFLEPLVPAYKIGSGDLTNLPVLEKIARKKKPVILSTGMAVLDEIKEAVRAIKKQKNNRIILLHCTTQYPCSFDEVNLRVLQTLKDEFKLLVGYSDHTSGITVPAMAVALGSAVIEKHFTLDRRLPGPDHQASLEPDELKKMVKAIRNAEKILGSDKKQPTKNEQKIKKVFRKGLAAKVFIAQGDKITDKMITAKRPAEGIAPKYLKRIIGKRAEKNIRKDDFIARSSVKI